MMNDTYTLVGSDGSVIVFDDIDYAILRDSLKGLSGYPAEYDVSYSAGHIGALVSSTHLIERTITLHVMIFGNGRADLESKRLRLIKAVNPLCGPARLYWSRESGDRYYIKVRPAEGSPRFTKGTGHRASRWDADLELICHDPSWYSAESHDHEFIRLTSGFSLPFTLPFTLGNLSPEFMIDNTGSAPVPVYIELHGRLTAPIRLTNETTGETIVIRISLAEGETLEISTDKDDLYVRFIDAEGVAYNALYYCSVGSRFWQLALGPNRISTMITRIYDSASGKIRWRNREAAL